jgi:photosystem II stability/assembly factor-like uncharacterized protein
MMSGNRRLGLALAALMALGAPAARAQTWTPVGPPGGDVRSLAADPRDPRLVYLGTADGMFYRSEDAGVTWQRQQPGFPWRGRSLDDLIVDPKGTVLVGFWELDGAGGGVARSRDGGRTFEFLPGIAGQAVRALAQSRSHPSILVVGTLSGVFRSRDGGATWRRISPEGHPDLRNVGSLAIDPADPDTMYIGTWHLPWKTTDGGRTWQPIATGMIDDSDVMTMTLDARDANFVYATACSGIYRSTDAAARWTRIRGIPSSSRRTRSFAQSPDRPDVLYAGTTEGVWSSEDGGVTWRQLTRKDVVVNSVLALPGGLMLVGAEGAGVLRSTDAGRSWFASNQGFSERFVSRVVFDVDSGRVLAGVWGDRRHGGVLTAPRPQGPWSRLGPGLEGREVLSLAAANGYVVAGTDDGVYLWPAPAGVAATAAAAPPAAPRRTLAATRPAASRPAVPPPPPAPVQPADPSDTGRRWFRLRTLVNGADVHPRVNDVVVRAEGGAALTITLATDRGLLRSGDSGATWKQPALSLPGKVVALAAARSDLMIAATALGTHLSPDGGQHWTQVSGGAQGMEVHGLAFLPGDDRVVFATTRRGLFRSIDQGRSWARVTGGVPSTDITGVAAHPDGHTVYVTEFGTGGIFRSRDAGQTWSRLPADGLVTERAWTVALDPRAPDRVVVASPSGGLHMLMEGSGGASSAGSR